MLPLPFTTAHRRVTAPGGPAGPAGPARPRGPGLRAVRWRSASRIWPFLIFAEVTALFLSWTVPTLRGASAETVAKPVSASATISAIAATTSAGLGLKRRMTLMQTPFRRWRARAYFDTGLQNPLDDVGDPPFAALAPIHRRR